MSSELKFDFSGRVAIITGAASGMGLLFCRCYAEAGGSVVMCDVNPDPLKTAVDEVNAIRTESAIGVPCDVRDYQQICRARDAAMRVFGRIDLVIPFAGGAEARVHGISGKIEFPDVPIEIYDWGIDVNLRGQLYLDHAVLGVMREQRSGLIIHVGSITGEEGSSYNIAYSATKSAAMNGLTRSVAQFGEPCGIRCCCVSPGPVLTRAAMSNMRTMLNRAAEPQEIVDLILFIASEKGEFVNGTNIMIDGGRAAIRRKDYGDK